MKKNILTRRPLVESIFELRWNLSEAQSGVKVDPEYKLAVGRLFERIKDRYPVHEPLPTAEMPDEISGYIVQHRFRESNAGWPLVQIGPGVITLNETQNYAWDDFRSRIMHLLDALFDVYLSPDFRVNLVSLRFIDAIDFNFDNDVFNFLNDMMGVDISIRSDLFESTSVAMRPLGLDLKCAFPASRPNGTINMRFARGGRGNIDALIWEIAMQSSQESIPNTKSDIFVWTNEAHSLIDDWFHKLIQGELQRRFE